LQPIYTLYKGAIAKNRITVPAKAQEVTENYQFAFSKLQAQPPPNQHPQTRNAKSSAGEFFISSEALRNG